MRKEVTVTHEILACEVCGRTILKGERTEPYLVQDGSRRLVCELCMRRAESAGWIREATHADMPATPLGAEPRPSLLDRFRSRWRADGSRKRSRPGRVEVALDGHDEPDSAPAGESVAAEPRPAYDPAEAAAPSERSEAGAVEGDHAAADPADAFHAEDGAHATGEPATAEEPGTADEGPHAASSPDGLELEEPAPDSDTPTPPSRERAPRGLRHRLRDPRHVTAVPTNAEVKVERALEVFNYSDYRRTVEGLVRTLGEPWVTAVPVLESTSEVVVVVAWELSWYQYRIDLGDSDDPVMLTHKGKELGELDVTLREWNAVADADGALALATPRGEPAP